MEKAPLVNDTDVHTAPPARPAEEWRLPLRLNLTFRRTEATSTRAALLSEGQYTAVWLVKYVQKTRCDGCGRERQAKELAVVRDDETGEEFHLGLDCMEILYGEREDRLRGHAADIRAHQAAVLSLVKLRDVKSTEQAVARIADLVRAYVPSPAPHLAALAAVDTFTPSKDDQDLLVKLRDFALYCREWLEDENAARRRWTALKTHPLLSRETARTRERLHALCERALASQTRLPQEEVHALNVWLRKAARWTSPFRQLVTPEDFETAEAYEAALRAKVLELAHGRRVPDHVHWNAPFVTHPTDIVSVKRGEGYSVAALEPREVRRFRSRLVQEDAYREGGLRGVVAEEGEEREHVQAAQYRRRGGFDREDEGDSDVLREERRFSYVPVAWALVEAFTATHRAWKRYGRASLEDYA